MKHQLSSLVVASAVLAGSAFTPVLINEASAASIQNSVKTAVEKVVVNGQVKNVTTVVIGKTKLYSTKDLARAASASVTYNQNTKVYSVAKGAGKQKKVIDYKADHNTAVANGKNIKLGTPSKVVGKTLFVEAKPFVQALGGDILTDGGLLISLNGGIKVSSASLNVEGASKSVGVLTINGKKLYSVQDVAKLFSATVKVDKHQEVTLSKKGTTVKFKVSTNSISVNGESDNTKAFPVSVKGTVYADLADLVTALGGDIITSGKSSLISLTGLVSGETFGPQWVNPSSILVTNETEEGARTLLIDVNTKKVLFEVNGTELAVSPSGKQALYSDENGFVYLVDLLSKKTIVLNGEDDSVKVEFVWSHDGKKAYFIQGEKSDKIYSVTLADGSLKKIYEDSKAYKSDLRLSKDGSKILYSVGAEGKTKYTDDDKTDVDTIDLTDTEAQFYTVSLLEAAPKAAAITVTKDIKIFPEFLANGNVVYVSADAESDELPKLHLIGADNKMTELVVNKDIVASTVTAQNKVMILVWESNNTSVIYEVNPVSKRLVKVAATPLELTSFSVSANGLSIAATTEGLDGEKVVFFKNGVFESVTK
ncbi:hypothetical protein GJU40_08335 [Bacillus lacus]|uniref:Copper amine oxidase-like N-terminal domain-containing protein n=1 Tax=Metabacillus lacus TaxID=1983721 RepID=A0A7X2LZP0_9BACI|nr:stalk domain-containing protein [Metabacillus lacus]MRX72157.1 hypothetical protein [Metabacillus lacus]